MINQNLYEPLHVHKVTCTFYYIKGIEYDKINDLSLHHNYILKEQINL